MASAADGRPAVLIAEAWAALVGNDSPPTRQTPPIVVTGTGGSLPSRLPVEDTAVACVAAALLAATALHRDRGGSPAPPTVDRDHVAAAVRSERYLRRGPQPAGMGFAPLSRFWRTADGWVRTHANYPWHREALLSVLGTSDQPELVGAAMAERRAADIEESVFAAGGIAVAVRTLADWRAHPQGRSVEGEPLIAHKAVDGAAPRTRPPAELPAAGIRVLDLTRVIAGPVCTRYLAALGAEVLRLDPPHRPDMRPGQVADTLLGKRSAVLDISSSAGSATLHRLLDGADVVVAGYRPGSLERFGLDEGSLAEHHPGVVAVYLDAWGHGGPWAQRRGFDSVVQAATGIAAIEPARGEEPGALPCQLLDHGTGYLAAAAVLDGLRRQASEGGTHIRRLSLARTARWLTSTPAAESPPAAPAGDSEPAEWLVELDSADGPVTAVAPPGRFSGRPLTWPSPVTGYGRDRPAWTS